MRIKLAVIFPIVKLAFAKIDHRTHIREEINDKFGEVQGSFVKISRKCRENVEKMRV